MFVWKVIKFIGKAIIRLIVFFLQIVLTIIAVLFGICGGYAELIGEIVGGILILCSFFCVVTGQVEVAMFVKMFLIGAAFSAIPAGIKLMGEEGIYAIKDALYKCVN